MTGIRFPFISYGGSP
ncbi:hypothetical protein R0I01_07910 [Bacillus pumilus]|nr:hypothetical protein R0I01_07910 [Bacillus pumilus]